MFHIVFNADDNYIKYTATLINSIIINVDTSKSFADFFMQDTISTPTPSKILQDYWHTQNPSTASNITQIALARVGG
ncbi:hypothetical protein CQA53_05865, partial [Helicobacter didelphidarum]